MFAVSTSMLNVKLTLHVARHAQQVLARRVPPFAEHPAQPGVCRRRVQPVDVRLRPAAVAQGAPRLRRWGQREGQAGRRCETVAV